MTAARTFERAFRRMTSLAGVQRFLPAFVILGVGVLMHTLTLSVGWGVEATFVIYMLAILVAAWYSLAQGLLVTVLVIAVLPFLFRPGFTVSQINLVGLISLGSMALVVTAAASAQRRAEQRLRDLNAALEARVQEKTRTLEVLLAREQVTRAEADRANRVKDEFLATISHELRGPLHGIVGFIPILRAGRLAPDQTGAALDIMDRSARTLTRLVEEMLDVSRIAAGKMTFDLGPTDVTRIVRETVQSIRTTAEAKDIALSVDVGDGITPILADGQRIQQAVWNLLSNAVKFTPQGGRVMVRAWKDDALHIEVEDTGVGITSEFLPHVFDRFSQAESPMPRSQVGLGLGLAIVRHVVERHGGGVHAASRGPNLGSTFRIDLPAPIAQVPAPPSAASHPPAGDLLRGLSVLVVDDHADARALLVLQLEQHGAGVCEADSAATAMGVIQAARVDVVVTDLAMPGVDGYQFLERLRNTAGLEDLPVIAVTGFAFERDRDLTRAAGFASHFSKPVDGDALASCLADLFSSSSAGIRHG